MTIITAVDTPKHSTLPEVAIKRAWHDLAPKLLAYLATGLTGSAVVAVLAALNITIAPGLAATIVVVVGAIAGYFVPDNGKAS